MKEKIQLSLQDLKIQSFVTALTEEEKMKMKGGGLNDAPYASTDATWACPSACPTSDCWSRGCTDGYCSCESGCSVTHCK